MLAGTLAAYQPVTGDAERQASMDPLTLSLRIVGRLRLGTGDRSAPARRRSTPEASSPPIQVDRQRTGAVVLLLPKGEVGAGHAVPQLRHRAAIAVRAAEDQPRQPPTKREAFDPRDHAGR